jgi:hypothetical protein
MREHGGATVRRLAAPLLWAVAPPAGAQELAAHWEADATWRYAVIQFTRAVPLGGPHELLAGIGGTQLSYHFSDADGRARLRSTGAALSLGYRVETANGTISAQGAFERRQSTWTPAVGVAEGTVEQGVTALAEAYTEVTPHRMLSALASYDGLLRYRLVRAGFAERAAGRGDGARLSVWLGADVTLQGDRTERAHQFGPVLAFDAPNGIWFALRAGLGAWRHGDGSRRVTPYLSATALRAF